MNPTNRRSDYLRECNNRSLPLEDFRLTFCVRCLQPECTRSTYGSSKFDQRTQTWVERLFTQVPRMDPSDPRFKETSEQNFSTIDLAANIEPGGGTASWLDPRELKSEKTSFVVPLGFIPPPPEETPSSRNPVEIAQLPVQDPSAETQPSKVQPVPTDKKASNLPRDVLLMNTVGHDGAYLPGAPSKPGLRPVRKDPWAVPEPIAPNEVIVERGATFRFSAKSERKK
jgi:hypothetical protein